MDFQKNKVLEGLTKHKWEIKEIVQPQSQNNWKEIEVIQLTKYGTSIYLSIDLDPTHSYLGYKKSSSDYDINMYELDPLEHMDINKTLAQLNLGKGWEKNLDKFLKQAEKHLLNRKKRA